MYLQRELVTRSVAEGLITSYKTGKFCLFYLSFLFNILQKKTLITVSKRDMVGTWWTSDRLRAGIHAMVAFGADDEIRRVSTSGTVVAGQAFPRHCREVGLTTVVACRVRVILLSSILILLL
jgi:hypothetical protein